MKMKLLIGHDGSDCANTAIDDLRRAGLPAEAEACVMTVADVWLPAAEAAEVIGPAPVLHPAIAAARERAAQAVEEANALSQDGAARVRACFPGWTVTAEAVGDSPYWALIKRADHWRPDLLVVGSHGRSAVGRAVMGSVAQKAVQHAQCSVRIGRSHSAIGEGKAIRIIVGVDGSSEATAAVGVVAGRNWPTGSEATVLAAADLRMATAVTGLFPPVDDAVTGARRAVDRAVEELRSAGLAATGVLREGDPKRALVAAAEEWGADCIFVGAHGLGRLDRFLIGSVSSSVTARAHCSVEVIRRVTPHDEVAGPP